MQTKIQRTPLSPHQSAPSHQIRAKVLKQDYYLHNLHIQLSRNTIRGGYQGIRRRIQDVRDMRVERIRRVIRMSLR
jgi:hypothetical protein